MAGVLLRIVRGISEDAWEEAANDPVSTLDEEAMFVRPHEVFVQQQVPDLLEELPPAELEDIGGWR